MNKTGIDWTDYSWNPVTGCRHDCPYCYARQIANRFGGFDGYGCEEDCERVETSGVYDLKEPAYIKRGKERKMTNAPFPFKFEPTILRYRLSEPQRLKKPSTIFVGSMTDLFGVWVPDEWIETVFDACKVAPWHRYLFLTKNPKRYCDLANAKKLPKDRNMWYGTTITGKHQTRFDGGIRYNTFLSIEPLMENLEAGLGSFGMTGWIIIGAMTGPGSKEHQPERAWVENIMETAAITKVPVFLKESIRNLFPDLPESRFPWDTDG